MQVVPRSVTTRNIIEAVACPYCEAKRGENCTSAANFDREGRFPQPMVTVHDKRRQAA